MVYHHLQGKEERERRNRSSQNNRGYKNTQLSLKGGTNVPKRWDKSCGGATDPNNILDVRSHGPTSKGNEQTSQDLHEMGNVPETRRHVPKRHRVVPKKTRRSRKRGKCPSSPSHSSKCLSPLASANQVGTLLVYHHLATRERMQDEWHRTLQCSTYHLSPLPPCRSQRL